MLSSTSGEDGVRVLTSRMLMGSFIHRCGEWRPPQEDKASCAFPVKYITHLLLSG